MALEAGRRLGPYEILAHLGAGGMGEVYRARDPRLGREVAIKVLPEALRCDVDRLRRFEREARAAGGINHPNILTVHDVGRHEGLPFVVSELLEGQTLRQRMRGAALRSSEVIDCGVQIARGLAVAHDKGIVHRDLKPENLFLTRDGVVKILDFGLAKWTGAATPVDDSAETESHAAATKPGIVMGTVGYMSPEQVRGQAVDHRSDVFALGVVLYEMLADRHPFKAKTLADTMTAILTHDPPELTGLEPPLPATLLDTLTRCLAKDPGQRPSARELEADLSRQRALLAPISGTVGQDDAETELRVTVGATPPRRGRKPGRLSAASAVLGAAAAGLAIAIYVGQTREDRSAARHSPPAFSSFAREYWRRELQGPPVVVSFDRPGGSLMDLLRNTAETAGLNFLVMPGTKDKAVQGRYLDLPWPDVLDGELKEHGLAWSYSDNTVMIAPPPDLRRVWGTDLLLFSTLSADVRGLLATARALLSGLGRVAAVDLGAGRAGVIVADSPLHVEYVGVVLTRLGLIKEPRQLAVDRLLCADPAIGSARGPLHVRFGLGGPKNVQRRVSLAWQDKDLLEGLTDLARRADKRLRLQAGTAGRMTLRFDDIPVAAALHHLLAVNGLEAKCDGDLITAYGISSRADNAVSMVIDIAAPARAEGVREGLEEVLLRSPDALSEREPAPETIEVLPAGNALRFVGRLSRARLVRLIVDALSEG